MQLLVLILSIIIFSQTLTYGIYEIKNHNKKGGIIVICIAVISFILPNLVIFIKGVY